MPATMGIYGSSQLDNGQVMYFGRQVMTYYGEDKNVRQAEFRVPALVGTAPIPTEGSLAPVIQATVYSITDNATTAFAVYEITHAYLGDQSQLVVSAKNTNEENPDSDLVFYCSVVIIGIPPTVPKTE